MTEWTFEPATADDAPMVAEWLFQTAPELLAYLFSSHDNAVRQMARHWPMARGIFSHRHAVFAKQGDEVLGLELGYSSALRERHQPDTQARFQADLDADALAALGARTADLGPMLPSAPSDAYYLEHLVVRPEARGTGCGRALLRRAFDQARASGLASLHLDVLSNNPATGFYIANGMADKWEIRVPKLVRRNGMPGIVRMVMEL